jgi:hypothetical protein
MRVTELRKIVGLAFKHAPKKIGTPHAYALSGSGNITTLCRNLEFKKFHFI